MTASEVTAAVEAASKAASASREVARAWYDPSTTIGAVSYVRGGGGGGGSTFYPSATSVSAVPPSYYFTADDAVSDHEPQHELEQYFEYEGYRDYERPK